MGCVGFYFWAPLYTFCVPRGIGGLGFFCMLDALCVILVYLEALGTFFLVYNTLTYQKIISNESNIGALTYQKIISNESNIGALIDLYHSWASHLT